VVVGDDWGMKLKSSDVPVELVLWVNVTFVIGVSIITWSEGLFNILPGFGDAEHAEFDGEVER